MNHALILGVHVRDCVANVFRKIMDIDQLAAGSEA
jgi:hypothetical protein